jgi:uncharacterized membrane protein
MDYNLVVQRTGEVVDAELTLTSVGVLGIIVLVRTFLSFSLEVELTGRWPWESGTTTVPPE